MNKNRILAILLVVAIIAVSSISYFRLATEAPKESEREISVTDRARQYVDEWKAAGASLPGTDECQFFATNFAETKSILITSLSHERHEVRMRGAFVIEKLGDAADSLSPDVLDSLMIEDHELVRIYLINAARAVGQGDDAILRVLQSLFRQPRNTKEQLFVAAALYVLSGDPGDKAAAEELICKYLLPYEKTDQQQSLSDYDDLRLSAVLAVEHMVGATKPIPLLQDMLRETGAKSWIRGHVPRVLGVLKRGSPTVEARPESEVAGGGSTRP